ncbi:hypothetical protein NX722_23610 [Endozoicomonas gorgoniicola]|uniref:Phage protein n=1 Tax=Endozoicomonas gorgoniicola TaxID=1234144 RepID=A0ABT3N1Q0_9GAMM|nr:hypothetical protein [Endozoicomonas gorgoniicola]MCW7555555.1 hypothetical protein [Endozoicomonas gorgoniicola]
MSELFYRFNPFTTRFDTLKYQEADWATDDDFPGEEQLCMLITGYELPDGKWVSVHYYETKERAILAAQDEIKEHIKKLESFLLEEEDKNNGH